MTSNDAQLIYAVGRYPRAGFDDLLWVMSYGTRPHVPDFAAFARERASITRAMHPYEVGPLAVYVWEPRPDEDFRGPNMIPSGAACFTFMAGQPECSDIYPWCGACDVCRRVANLPAQQSAQREDAGGIDPGYWT